MKYLVIVIGITVGAFVALTFLGSDDSAAPQAPGPNPNWVIRSGDGSVEKVDTLLEAVETSNLEAVEYYVTRDDVNAKDTFGRTALHNIKFGDQVKIATVLIDHGADVNAKTKDGDTPLRSIMGLGTPEMVKLLVERGANIDEQDAKGHTPLDWAIWHAKDRNPIGDAKFYEVVKYLKSKGARTNKEVKDAE